jgi:hypothetical protein
MDLENNILEELLEISPLLVSIGHHNVYTVPTGYFDGLTNKITAQAKDDSTLQMNISNPFRVPVGYFDGLANNILFKIKARSENEVFTELEEIAPLLNTIDKRNIYTVPPAYFESFSSKAPAEKPQPARVFNMLHAVRKRFSYAVAAAVVGVLLTVAFLYKNNNALPVSDPSASANTSDVKERISTLSDAEIANYLDTHSSGDKIITSPSAEDNSDAIDIQHSLNNASDEEIQEYLDSNRISSERSSKGI